MTYTDHLVALAAAAQLSAVRVYRAYVAHHLDAQEFAALLAARIGRSNSQAAALAATAFSARLMQALRRPVPVAVIEPADDGQRLRKAATTVLAAAESSDVPEAIVKRLARSEPLSTAARAYSAAIADSPHVVGWTRHTNADACELCRWWAAGGKVFAPDHEFRTHHGCTCTQVPIIEGR